MDLRVDRDGEVPLGTQLAWKLRALIEAGELGAGARLPSVREAASAAGVNVNTVRTVYGRLERDGLVTTEQGRGTFVRPSAEPGPDAESAGEARRALRRQIARLESELARRPPPPTEAPGVSRRPGPGSALLSAEQLEDVRDDLLGRLRALDDARAEVMRRLDELRPPPTRPRRRRPRAGEAPGPRAPASPARGCAGSARSAAVTSSSRDGHITPERVRHSGRRGRAVPPRSPRPAHCPGAPRPPLAIPSLRASPTGRGSGTDPWAQRGRIPQLSQAREGTGRTLSR